MPELRGREEMAPVPFGAHEPYTSVRLENVETQDRQARLVRDSTGRVAIAALINSGFEMALPRGLVTGQTKKEIQESARKAMNDFLTPERIRQMEDIGILVEKRLVVLVTFKVPIENALLEQDSSYNAKVADALRGAFIEILTNNEHHYTIPASKVTVKVRDVWEDAQDRSALIEQYRQAVGDWSGRRIKDELERFATRPGISEQIEDIRGADEKQTKEMIFEWLEKTGLRKAKDTDGNLFPNLNFPQKERLKMTDGQPSGMETAFSALRTVSARLVEDIEYETRVQKNKQGENVPVMHVIIVSNSPVFLKSEFLKVTATRHKEKERGARLPFFYTHVDANGRLREDYLDRMDGSLETQLSIQGQEKLVPIKEGEHGRIFERIGPFCDIRIFTIFGPEKKEVPSGFYTTVWSAGGAVEPKRGETPMQALERTVGQYLDNPQFPEDARQMVREFGLTEKPDPDYLASLMIESLLIESSDMPLQNKGKPSAAMNKLDETERIDADLAKLFTIIQTSSREKRVEAFLRSDVDPKLVELFELLSDKLRHAISD